MRETRDDAEQRAEFLVELVEQRSIIDGGARHHRRRRRRRQIAFVNRQNHVEIGNLRQIVVVFVHDVFGNRSARRKER